MNGVPSPTSESTRAKPQLDATNCSFCGRASTLTGAHAQGREGTYICERWAYLALGFCRQERAKQLAELQSRLKDALACGGGGRRAEPPQQCFVSRRPVFR